MLSVSLPSHRMSDLALPFLLLMNDDALLISTSILNVCLFSCRMSDLALPFLLLMNDDALAFAAFKSFMQKVCCRFCC